MTVRLARMWYWSNLVVSDRYDHPVINNYSLRTEFSANSLDNNEHNVAYNRMKFWFLDVMESSVLISHDHPKVKHWQETGSRVLIFPEDPVDQLVGMMLYSKLTAITQDRIVLDRVSIASPLDDEVIYHHFADEDLGPFADAGWWNDARPIWHTKPGRGKGKVISLDRVADWKDHELDWDRSQQENIVSITKITDED